MLATEPALTHSCPQKSCPLYLQWASRFEVTPMLPFPKWDGCSKLHTFGSGKSLLDPRVKPTLPLEIIIDNTSLRD